MGPNAEPRASLSPPSVHFSLCYAVHTALRSFRMSVNKDVLKVTIQPNVVANGSLVYLPTLSHAKSGPNGAFTCDRDRVARSGRGSLNGTLVHRIFKSILDGHLGQSGISSPISRVAAP